MPTESTKTITPAGQGGNYNSLNAWEAGEQDNLPASGRIAIAAITGNWSGVIDDVVTLDGWETNLDNYIKIHALSGARHAGVWDDTKYRISGINNYTINCLEAYLTLSGLQLHSSISGSIDSDWRSLLFQPSTGGYLTLVDSIFRGSVISGTDRPIGVDVIEASGRVANCLFYNFKRTGAGQGRGLGVDMFSTGLVAQNCTFFNCDVGVKSFYGVTYPIVKNCLTQNCATGFQGDFSGVSSHNFSSVNDAPGTNTVTGTVLFVNSGNADFRLSPYDTGALMRGTGLFHLFTTDIEGISRGTGGGVWDIGSHHVLSYIKTIKPEGQSGNYNSLMSWESDQEKDLVAINKIAVVEIGGNWTGTDIVDTNIDGWTTSRNNYIHIFTTGTARHSGIWSDNCYQLTISASAGSIAGIYVPEDNTKIEGIQFRLLYPNPNEAYGILLACTANGLMRVDSCIFRAQTAMSGAMYGYRSDAGSSQVTNCLFYDWSGTVGEQRPMAFQGTQTGSFLMNSTFWNCRAGIHDLNGSPGNTRYNNIILSQVATGFISFNDPHIPVTGSSHNFWEGGFFIGDSPLSGIVTFVDAAGGDFRLSSSDTGALGRGSGLSDFFTNDIIGAYRGTATGGWDLGAFYGSFNVVVYSGGFASNFLRADGLTFITLNGMFARF
jgi:hypothetical protein